MFTPLLVLSGSEKGVALRHLEKGNIYIYKGTVFSCIIPIAVLLRVALFVVVVVVVVVPFSFEVLFFFCVCVCVFV